MQTPVQVTFKDIQPDDAVREEVWRQAEDLEHFYDRITSCRVVVAAPHRHSRTGRLHAVRVELGVPGTQLVVGRGDRRSDAHADVHLAVRDAFRAARRQLEDYARRQRGDVKRHKEQPIEP
ncbi:MAG: HPF/RaiA family ribosome-associated protein [Planctomycetota bacterium]|jgi:ribosome-associated translation inhibitor RaiA